MLRICQMFVFLSCTVLSADEIENVLSLPAGEMSASVQKAPMPELGESRIGQILNRYYRKGLGGPENWGKILSLKLSGTLKTQQGALQLKVFRKKPEFIKTILFDDSAQTSRIRGYDGKLAWQQKAGADTPEVMAGAEARRFIHRAPFGSYLLYPFAEGKRIRLIDTVPVEGKICHQVRVELDTGYRVDYFIDIRSYLEIQVVHSDQLNSTLSSVIYKDYARASGIPVAKKVKRFEQGEWVSTLKIHEVKVNSGMMPWMFHMSRSQQ